MRILKLKFIVLIYALFFNVVAASASTEFDRQCQRLQPQADAFAQKCLMEAVPFSRMFLPSGGARGENESFSVLFSDAFPNSHFIMGCVLNADRNLHYVGLYYKTSTAQLPAFTSEDIGFVDFQDNVGLRINGRKHILIAVRQFVTNTIPQRYGTKVRNCELGDLEGYTPTSGSSTLVRNPVNRSEWIYRYQGSAKQEVNPYRVFFGSGMAPHIWKVLGDTVVDADGALLVLDNWHLSACSKWRDVYAVEGIIQETCGQREHKQSNGSNN